MKRNHTFVLPVIILLAGVGGVGACASSRTQQRPTETTSYTLQTNKGTTVTVQPPEPVSTTRTTSSQLVVTPKERDDKHPLLTDQKQSGRAPGHPNGQLDERIGHALATDEALRDVALYRVRVVTIDGRVTLSGLVETVADKVEIEQRVRSVKGVEAVDNQIEVLR